MGRLYVECAARGELHQFGQRATDVGALLRAGMERFGKPDLVVADRWREAELRDALDKAGVSMAAFETRGMGYRRWREMSANSAAPVPRARLRRHHHSCSGARWPKPGRSAILPGTPNSARARKAGAE